jgi:MFS transporter, ACS family, hexuronate transporter
MVYVIATVGSIGGGGISAVLLKRGKSLNVSRKMALLICALCVVPVISAPYLHNLWSVVAVVGLAAAAHQGWSANLFTLPSDMFPKAAVGSVIGIGGMSGAIGGVLLQLATGYIVKITNSYVPLFVVACVAYVLALAIIHGITPRLAPAHID